MAYLKHIGKYFMMLGQVFKRPQKGRVFKEEEDMTLWISDDVSKVPIRLKADLLVGAIKMDLVAHKNLSGTLNMIED